MTLSKYQLQLDQAYKGRDDVPATPYRVDLFKIMQGRRQGINGRLGLREIARGTSLAVNTVKKAIDGRANLETLWRLSQFFGIPWIVLFDVERRFKLDFDENGVGVQIVEYVDGAANV